MTWKMFVSITIIALLTTICIQQTRYLEADWCSAEIELLRSQVSEIHGEIVSE
jgi:low affinity Fe/Cu permease